MIYQLIDSLYFWLPLLFEISDNKFIVIYRVLVCHFKNFEINLSFLIKPFANTSKISGQK